MNYYNENDPDACQWIRNLIADGLIPAGEVDERSIKDVKSHELTRFTSKHFFAGVSGWPLALRMAGWPDARPVTSGSCPCQPFSQSGDMLGEADPRHLWPWFRDLIGAGQPAITFGEQVASALGRVWLAGVRSDLEALAYEVGGSDLCSAGVGAPNIRQRIYWVANPDRERCSRIGLHLQSGAARQHLAEIAGSREIGWLADTDSERAGRNGGTVSRSEAANSGERQEAGRITYEPDASGAARGLGHADHSGLQGRGLRFDRDAGQWIAWETGSVLHSCTDGKSRRVEPSVFPLAPGIPSRMGPMLTALRPVGRGAIKAAKRNRIIRIRGYGNAINVVLASEFIRASCEAIGIELNPDTPTVPQG